ncbi:membrane protein [Fervidicella metallireducens AeB]|uniref:Membrane protein n=1 Tax=Fervidicella metallireducens AeB TaxID=1403537 RepID=A0A017RWD4_9CLOT|nr:membrane protein [Fervidicella metallireducens AeB]
MVFARTILLYIIVVAVMRIMGKRQIGELQPFELVIAIMLSELAAVPMQDTGIPLIRGIIPILTLMILEILISYLTLKFQPFRKVTCGVPSILIKHGKVQEEELRRQRFNLDDLTEELRLMGYINIADIEYAILETSGKLSIIPKFNVSPLTKQDMKIPEQKIHLPIGLILDGKLNEKNLVISGRDINWLNKELKKNGIDKIEDVFIAMLDSNDQLFLQRRLKNEK